MGQRLVIHMMNGNEENIKDREEICNAYYHWSAYTWASLQMLDEIIKNVNDDKKIAEVMNNFAKENKGIYIECLKNEINKIKQYINEIKKDDFKEVSLEELFSVFSLRSESNIKNIYENYKFLEKISKKDISKNKNFKMLGLLYLTDAAEYFKPREWGLIAIKKEEIDALNSWSEGDIWIDIEKQEFTFDVWFTTSKKELIENYGETGFEIIDEKINFDSIKFKDFDSWVNNLDRLYKVYKKNWKEKKIESYISTEDGKLISFIE